MHYDAVVLGGGITGLSTVFYLNRECAQTGAQISCALFEASNNWGGKFITKELTSESGARFLIEEGPDSFISQKPAALELAKELGLQHQLINAQQENSQLWIYLRKKLVAMPEGVIMMVPTKFLPFIVSPLISIFGKIRMAAELFVKPRRTKEDESLAHFVRRRMGKEVLEKIAEPLLAGIFSADPEKQSLLSSFPHFKEIENKHGSLILGFLRARFQKHKTGKISHTAFVSLKNGMQEICDALVPSLGKDGFLNTAIMQIDRLEGGNYLLKFSDGTQVNTKSLVLTLPAYATARLISSFAPEAASLLDNIRYVGTGNISLAYKNSDISAVPRGFGVLIPKSEKRSINSISLCSQKFSDRASINHSLIRVSFGGSRNVEMMALEDGAILSRVRSDLADILGIKAAPVLTNIKRWKNAMPQYDVGHQSLVEQIEKALPPGLILAGSAFHGVSIPDCITQGKRAAKTLLAAGKNSSDGDFHRAVGA